MVLEVVIDKRRTHRDSARISVNPKLNRIVINKKARELIERNHKKQLTHVQLLRDPDVQNAFWMRPCEPTDIGARQIDTSSGTTLTVSCRLLLKELKWKAKETQSFPISWDAENNAAKVDLS
jgi:hypothetical protein